MYQILCVTLQRCLNIYRLPLHLFLSRNGGHKFSRRLVTGAKVLPRKLQDLAIERMWDVAMAFALGRVSREFVIVRHDVVYMPLKVAHEYQWDYKSYDDE